MAKRKRNAVAVASCSSQPTEAGAVTPPNNDVSLRPASTRMSTRPRPTQVDANPTTNKKVVDGLEALRASPDAHGEDESFEPEPSKKKKRSTRASRPTPANIDPANARGTESIETPSSHPRPSTRTDVASYDPEAAAEGLEEEDDPEEITAALSRAPPVHSSYLPLPWKGRLGYACLNTYLRNSNPPVFSSRTCRIASILENRHPLKDPSQPAHATKNRPDKDQPADHKRGQTFVEGLGLANAQDIPKMLRWNDKYGIKFLRLSSEMFPFASHAIYGYRLTPFASESLAEAGRVAAELGHRLTTHPGQFTQLGSPRKEVIDASFRDLEYHAELLTLLKLPEQLDRDAVMIVHMGGVFGDKGATLDRFRKNYAKLSPDVKKRLVLENDDVCYTVHDLLPICEELNIPLVLDFHHHNILFDQDKLREGTKDIMDLYPRIKATWNRKHITQKMHYSEPTSGAITGRQRRKHNPRPATLPPCAINMDLMIEAKDKEQAVFELMRNFKLPGFDTFNDITPYVRDDENRAPKMATKKSQKKSKNGQGEEPNAKDESQTPPVVADGDLNMGGPSNRVYWPPGMEEWLRPKKRQVKNEKQIAEAASSKQAKAKASVDHKAEDSTITSKSASSSRARPPKGEKGVEIVRSTKASSGTIAKPRKSKSLRIPTPSTSETDAEHGQEEEDDGEGGTSVDDTKAPQLARPTTAKPRARKENATNQNPSPSTSHTVPPGKRRATRQSRTG